MLTSYKIKEKVHNFLTSASPKEQEEYLVATHLFLSDSNSLEQKDDCIKKIEEDYDFSFLPEVVQRAKQRILHDCIEQKTKE